MKPHQSGIIERLVEWWREGSERRALVGELAQLGPEAKAVAQDAGLSVSELQIMVAKGAHAADRLHARLAERALDGATLAQTRGDVMRDLTRVCTVCGETRRCDRDLARDAKDPRWREYCPNVHTFDALQGKLDAKPPPSVGKN